MTGPGLLLVVLDSFTPPPVGNVVGLGTTIVFISANNPSRREMSRPISVYYIFFCEISNSVWIALFNHTRVLSGNMLVMFPKKQPPMRTYKLKKTSKAKVPESEMDWHRH